jgi:ribose transport system ATP-binding protein
VAASEGRHWRGIHVSRRSERRATAEAIKSFNIKAPSVDAPFATLSGGNQQKAILARWFERSPGLLLLDEPTQGVDVGAKAGIYALIANVAQAGAGVLICSSDAEELALLCDRVVVLRDGTAVAELHHPGISEAALMRAGLGASPTTSTPTAEEVNPSA